MGSCRPQQGLRMRTSIDHTTDEGCFVPDKSQECISHSHGIYRSETPNYSLELHVHTSPGDGMGINKFDSSLYPIVVLREYKKAGRGSWAWCGRVCHWNALCTGASAHREKWVG